MDEKKYEELSKEELIKLVGEKDEKLKRSELIMKHYEERATELEAQIEQILGLSSAINFICKK